MKESLSLSLFSDEVYVAQSGLEILGSSDPPASVSLVARITGMCHSAWLKSLYYKNSSSYSPGAIL
jgi:hypothetical protein